METFCAACPALQSIDLMSCEVRGEHWRRPQEWGILKPLHPIQSLQHRRLLPEPQKTRRHVHGGRGLLYLQVRGWARRGLQHQLRRILLEREVCASRFSGL